MRFVRGTVCWLWVLLLAALPAGAQPYTITEIPTLGTSYAVPVALNEQGLVLLQGTAATGGYRAYLWHEALGVAGVLDFEGRETFPQDVNDAGAAVGHYRYPASNQYGYEFVRVYWPPDGPPIPFGDPVTPAQTHTLRINALGQSAFHVPDAGGVYRAYRFDPVTGVQPLGSLAGSFTSVRDLNDLGTVVGSSRVSTSASHAFRWNPLEGMVDLHPEGWDTSDAGFINNRGEIAGSLRLSSTSTQALAIWLPGQPVPIGLPLPATAWWVSLLDFNEAGQLLASTFSIEPGGLFTVDYFLFDANGTYTLLSSTNGSAGFAPTALNNLGRVAGYLVDDAGVYHCAVWTQGAGVEMLPEPVDAQGCFVADLNDRGQITGYANLGTAYIGVFWQPDLTPPTPEAQVEALQAEVEALLTTADVAPGDVASLGAKLEAVTAVLQRVESGTGSPKTAVNVLGAFVNQMQALVRSGRLTPEAAAPLIDAAERLSAELAAAGP